MKIDLLQHWSVLLGLLRSNSAAAPDYRQIGGFQRFAGYRAVIGFTERKQSAAIGLQRSCLTTGVSR
jgi:hypothetical protein